MNKCLILSVILLSFVNFDLTSGGFLNLINASSAGNIELARQIIESGVDVNAHKRSGLCYSALIQAISSKSIEMIKMLIAHGADINLCVGNQCPINKAIFEGNVEIVKLFLENGADVNNLKEFNRDSILHTAFRMNNNDGPPSCRDQIIILLINANALKNLHNAAKWQLDSLANIDAQNAEGYTALHIASSSTFDRGFRIKRIELLLQAGANKNIKNNDDKVPHDLAATEEIKDLIISSMYIRRR